MRRDFFGLPPWALCAAIFGVTLAAYFPALSAGYVWNDVDYVTRPDLRSLHGLWRIWSEPGATEQYYPLLHSAFWVEHHLWGDAALGYHLGNILLHATSACLLAFALRRLAVRGAWLAGFIFALHPVCVESVAWISEQKNTLSTVLFLAAGLIYLHYDQSRHRGHYRVATIIFVLALFSKSLTATLPPALLVIFWWQRGRLEWRRDVVPLLPWFVLGAAVGMFTGWFEHNIIIGASGVEFQLSLLERGLVAGRAIWFYLGKTLWPTELTFIYPRWTVSATEAWQYLFPLGVVALLGVLWWLRRRWRGPVAALLFFTGTLFPVMGFFNLYAFMFSYVADHWQYLSMIGLIVPVAVGFTYLPARLPAWAQRESGKFGLALALVGTLGVMTWQQSRMYRDAETLYRVTLERNPLSWMSHHNLAILLTKKPGGQAEAIARYRTVLQLNPISWKARINLAKLLIEKGQSAEAIRLLEQALQLDPDNTQAHFILGLEFLKLPGRMADARTHFHTVVRLTPRDSQAQNNYAFTLASVPGRLPEAIAHYEAALRVQPDYAQAHNNLGAALMKMPGRQAEAVAHYETAVRLKPDMADARFNLAIALLKVPGRLDDAIRNFEALLQLQPNDAEAHNRLGEALVLAGRSTAARAHFETALRLKPGYRAARDNLARLNRPDEKTRK